jgi:hypothetical protein
MIWRRKIELDIDMDKEGATLRVQRYDMGEKD